MSGYLDGLGRVGRRVFREALAVNAEATAQEWAENSQDVYRGEFVPVRDPAAIEALRRVYEVVLRRGGVDHVERISPDAALSFPSQADFVKPSPVFAYFGYGFVTGDYSMSIEEFARERLQLGAWLAAGVDREGFCRFAVLVRPGDQSPEFDRTGRHDAMRLLAFNTLDPAARAAFFRNVKQQEKGG